jgi:hypothetical protein
MEMRLNHKEKKMEMSSQNDTMELDELEALNQLSEETIKDDYLNAAIHGPRWILGLIDEAI